MVHRTIVDAATLAAHLDDPTWVAVDVRFELGRPEFGRQAFAAGTIPGAVFADLDRDLSAAVVPGRTGRHPLPDAQVLAQRFGEWGIGSETQVVVFDQRAGAFAARLWWLLRWLGHEAVAVLDGGFAGWTAEGRPIAPGAASSRRASFVPHVRSDRVADAAQVAAADPRHERVFDARAADRYRGENETTDPVGGHIPGAQSVPFADNLGPDGRMRAPAELRARFEAALAGTAPDRAICYCGSGVTACHDILAMVHAGLAPARLYPGSWSEWITDPGRPRATGPE
jgi:thiosulfate/3-mercaptopyruvate sulfurtransferase